GATGITEARVREAAGTTSVGTDIPGGKLADALTALDPHGATWQGGQSTAKQLTPEIAREASAQPWVAEIAYNDGNTVRQHAVIVDRIADGMVYIRDPQGLYNRSAGTWSGVEGVMHVDHFVEIWTGGIARRL